MKSPILGSAYVARSVNAADNRMVNLFPEITPEGGKEPAFLNRAPGLRLLNDIGDGPIRGMWTLGNDLYVVSGQELYRMDAAGLTEVVTPDPEPPPSPSGVCDPLAPALTGAFTVLADPPYDSWGSALAGNATKILMVGGAVPGPNPYHSNAALYDIGSGLWTAVAPFPQACIYDGEYRVFHAVTVDEDKFLVLMAGYLYEYSVSGGAWTAKASTPDADKRAHRYSVAWDSAAQKLYVFGGLLTTGAIATTATGTNVILVYTYAAGVGAGTWGYGLGSNDAHWAQQAGVTFFGGKLYVAGGLDAPFGNVVEAVKTYNPADGSWATVAATPASLIKVSAASTGEGVYLVNGAADAGVSNSFTRVNAAGELSTLVTNDTWLGRFDTLPTLCRAGSCDLYLLGSNSFGSNSFVRFD